MLSFEISPIQHQDPWALRMTPQEELSCSGRDGRRRRRRRGSSVAFRDEVTVIPQSSPLDAMQTTAEWSAVWYDADEMESFRAEAREICRELRVRYKTENDETSTAGGGGGGGGGPKNCSLAFDEETRGLEQRACLERQRRKYLSIKYVVRAQNQLRDANKLAALSHKCTRWAAALASEEARRDFVRSSEGPFPVLTLKRAAAEAADETLPPRNLRRRVSTDDHTSEPSEFVRA